MLKAKRCTSHKLQLRELSPRGSSRKDLPGTVHNSCSLVLGKAFRATAQSVCNHEQDDARLVVD